MLLASVSIMNFLSVSAYPNIVVVINTILFKRNLAFLAPDDYSLNFFKSLVISADLNDKLPLGYSPKKLLFKPRYR